MGLDGDRGYEPYMANEKCWWCPFVLLGLIVTFFLAVPFVVAIVVWLLKAYAAYIEWLGLGL